MDREIKIKTQLVTKEYNLFSKQSDKLKSLLSLSDTKTFWALRGISFTAYSGDTIGIIGVNGSGKSTLSNVISGIIPPTSGSIEISGDVSIISIGAGLKGELTGRENIFLKGLMSGMSNKEIKKHLNEIIEFADIGDFIDQPVKNYSSGMKARLGFSIAVHHNMDILVIDEALAVGDDTFYQKCVEKMMSLKAEGKTILFVSHSLGQVQKLCEKTMWLHYGELLEFGDTKEVINKYKKFTKDFKSKTTAEKKAYQKSMKSKQQKFTLDYLRDMKINETEELSRKKIRSINQVVEKNPIGDKMSTATKVLLTTLIGILLFLCVVSLNDNALSGVFNNPIGFIQKQFREISNKDKENNSNENQKLSSMESNFSEYISSESAATGSSSTNSTTSTEIEVASKNENFSFLAEYTVQESDSLESIAKLHQIPTEVLKESNNLSSNSIFPGEVLYIPWIGGE